MAKQSCILLISFYDTLYGAEKARLNGIETDQSMERAVAVLHPPGAQVKWLSWTVSMDGRNLSKEVVVRFDRELIISLLLHQAFSAWTGFDLFERVSRTHQEQLFAAGIDAETVEEVRKRLTVGRSALLMIASEDCAEVTQSLQKDADFFLQKSLIWDEELLVALGEVISRSNLLNSIQRLSRRLRRCSWQVLVHG